jgi:HAD superfamily hydrolase (TIGR01509 family)
MKILVLDAMGVIYSVGDDVKDLLYPFIMEKGGTRDFTIVQEYYNLASLGKISAVEFWKTVGIAPHLEDEYLRRLELTVGLLDFLKNTKSRGVEIWCLSNDLSEWSTKLRIRFGLEKYFRGFVISGDIGIRKPDPMIYHNLLNRLNVKANDVIFVDDNPKNIDAASRFGFFTVLFSPAVNAALNEKYFKAATFNDIKQFLD